MADPTPPTDAREVMLEAAIDLSWRGRHLTPAHAEEIVKSIQRALTAAGVLRDSEDCRCESVEGVGRHVAVNCPTPGHGLSYDQWVQRAMLAESVALHEPADLCCAKGIVGEWVDPDAWCVVCRRGERGVGS